MRISESFGKTQREIPADADTISHRLMLRAGMIRQIAAGVYSYLPLAWRALNKVENVIRDEMDKAGGQELMMPVLQPIELWQQTCRDQTIGQVLFKLNDRRDRQLVLGPTHEEVITELVKYNVQSYRDLPLMLYQIQTKFRDEQRPRGGLIRAREFGMKDLYSFDIDDAGLNVSYEKMRQAYENICRRCGVPVMMVEADSGAIGGKECHEFTLITEAGEDEILHCSCGYAANSEKAIAVKGVAGGGEPLPVEEIATPGAATIEEVAGFLKIAPERTLKAIFYIADGKFIFVITRGDLEANETKLKNALHCTDLRMATEGEVLEAGLMPGAASPVGIKGPMIVADDSVTSGTNFVAGGNKPATHLKNVNYPRDFKADIITDIAKARVGDTCPKCGKKLGSSHAIELGHIFKLGTFYTEKLGARFIDKDGQSRPIIMGCYGIGPTRLLAAIIEQNHDDKGIIWPREVAPYQIEICPLYREGTSVKESADRLYKDLTGVGLQVLMDDREESPGVKFNDADLLGIPVRVTVSPRSLDKNSVEVKLRSEKQAQLVPVDDAIKKLMELAGRK
jgi:prolyl-tRNA synthetase